MKQILLICAAVALVGCGKEDDANTGVVKPNLPSPKAAPEKLIADHIVEKAIRKHLKKPKGELTKADLEKVTKLFFVGVSRLTDAKGLENLTQLKELYLFENQLTDVKGLERLTQLKELGLIYNKLTDVKGLEKLTQLTRLSLTDNPDLTKAQIAELQKALPNCKIQSNPTK